MALEVPLVPINSDAKVFAASDALQQAINNLRFAQPAGAGGAGQTKALSDAQKKEDDAAKKSAIQKLLDERMGGQPVAAPAETPVTPSFQSAPVGDLNVLPDIGSMV